jgi:hypothetical protein
MSNVVAVLPNDFLMALVDRALGHANTLAPRLPLLFEPVAGMGPADDNDVESPCPRPSGSTDVPFPSPRIAASIARETRVEVVERVNLPPQPATDPAPAALRDAPTVAPLLVSRLTARHESETLPTPRRAQDSVGSAAPTPNPLRIGEYVENGTAVVTPTPRPDHISQAVLTFRVAERKENPVAAPTLRRRNEDTVQVATRPLLSGAPAAPPAVSVLTPKPIHVQPLPERQPAAGEASGIAAPLPTASEPEINVTIGVIEVRATEKIGAPSQPRIDRNRRAMSLDEYLKQRRG